MRKPVIAGNWKMYKTVGDSVATALALKPLVANANHCEVVIAPVFTALKSVADRLEGSNIKVAGPAAFVRSFVLKGGWRDGRTGWTIAKMAAYHASLKHSLLLALQSKTGSHQDQ